MKPLENCTMLLIAAALTAVLTGGAAAQDGKALYDKNCKSCHGPAGGAPLPAMVKQMNVQSITDPDLVAKLSEDSMANVIKNGKGKFMKPYAGKLKPNEINALAKYLKTFAKKPG